MLPNRNSLVQECDATMLKGVVQARTIKTSLKTSLLRTLYSLKSNNVAVNSPLSFFLKSTPKSPL